MKWVVLSAMAAAMMTTCRESGDRVYVFTGEAMGTTYRVKSSVDREALKPEIDAMLAALDRDLSTWRDDSWVSQFNRAPAGTTMPLPPVVSELLQKSLVYHAQTEGRYDPTIGALIRLWGFGAWRDTWAGEPTAEEMAAAREAVGFRHLEIEEDRITKRHVAVMLDFSAMAKGYAVDRIGDRLRAAGCEHFIIDFGGDILAAGNHPGRVGWTVDGAALDQPLTLHDEAIAMSGSEHQFRGDQSHVIDPRSGWPVPVGSPVFAMADSCAKADAMATAALVAGDATAEVDGSGQ